MRIFYILILLFVLACDDDELTKIYGCTNQEACNFNPNATIFDESCEYSDDLYDCDGNCIGDNYSCSLKGNWVLKQTAHPILSENYDGTGVGGEEEDITIENCIADYADNQYIRYYSSTTHYNDNTTGCLGSSDDEVCEFTVEDDLYISDYFMKVFTSDYENLHICNLTSNTFELCENCNDCNVAVINIYYHVDDIFLEMIIFDTISEQTNPHCRHEIYVISEQSDFIEYGCADIESCHYESTATHQLYGNSCGYMGNYDFCNFPCADLNWGNEIGYLGELDGMLGGYTPYDFAWNRTEETGGEYIGEIYVPNYEYFCTQDQVNCYTANDLLITENNYNQNTIAYIDLPHDNIGLIPLDYYSDTYYLSNDIMNGWEVLFESGCYTNDPYNGGVYINDFDENHCVENFYDIAIGINTDDYDVQYLSPEDIQIAISDGNFDNVDIFNCNAVSYNGLPWDGIGNFNEANFSNNFIETPCNADIIYMGEYIYNVDEEYGMYNPFGDLELNVCSIPYPNP